MKKLLEVKQEIGTISKNATNPFFKSQYMDLNQLLTEIEPILMAKGLLLTQPIENNCVVSRITDTENGETVESSLPLMDFSKPQDVGGCITYFRRYTLKSLLAIAEEDNDGNGLVKAKVSKKAATEETLTSAKAKGYSMEEIQKHYTVTAEQIKNY